MQPDAAPPPDPYAHAAAEALRLWRWNLRVAREGGHLAPSLRAFALTLARERGLDPTRLQARAEAGRAPTERG